MVKQNKIYLFRISNVFYMNIPNKFKSLFKIQKYQKLGT